MRQCVFAFQNPVFSASVYGATSRQLLSLSTFLSSSSSIAFSSLLTITFGYRLKPKYIFSGTLDFSYVVTPDLLYMSTELKSPAVLSSLQPSSRQLLRCMAFLSCFFFSQILIKLSSSFQPSVLNSFINKAKNPKKELQFPSDIRCVGLPRADGNSPSSLVSSALRIPLQTGTPRDREGPLFPA